MKKRIVIFSILLVVVLIVVYLCLFAVPFLKNKSVSQAYQEECCAEDFYSDEEGEDRVCLLDDGQQAFYCRMELVSRAQEEIIVSAYSTTDGNSTRIFFGALLQKAQEGVKVKIVLDGKYAGFSGSAKSTKYALVAAENIELYLYNSFHFLKPTQINACMHDKYLIVDGKYMLLGGRNIGDHYFNDETYDGKLTLDREVLVYNAAGDSGAIAQTRAYFDRVVAEDVCKLSDGLSGGKTKKGIARAEELKKQYEAYAAEHLTEEIDYESVTVKTNRVTLISNPTDAHLKEPQIGYALYQLALNSEEIVVQSPYVILDSDHLAYFENLKEKDITLLTNSIASTPNLLGYSNYYVRRGNVLKATGMTAYEYQDSESSIHAKTYLFDGRITAIGSFNLDERSLHIDTETMLVIDSEEFNAIVRETVGSYLAKSLVVGEDGKYLPSETVEEVKAGTVKKIGYKIIGTVLRPFVALL